MFLQTGPNALSLYLVGADIVRTVAKERQSIAVGEQSLGLFLLRKGIEDCRK
jgi:hypothetical protein